MYTRRGEKGILPVPREKEKEKMEGKVKPLKGCPDSKSKGEKFVMGKARLL